MTAILALLLDVAGPECRAPCQRRARALAVVLSEVQGGKAAIRWPHKPEPRVQVSPLLPLLARVAWAESSYRADAVNSRTGAFGYMGLNPSPTADPARWCRDLDIHEPRSNVLCGARILARALRLCGTEEAALSRYRGHRCGPSAYAKMVLP